MISRATQVHYRQRLFGSFCLSTLILLLAVTSRAQMGGIDPEPHSPGTGGRGIIDGRIYYPSGRNVDKRLKVTLVGVRGGDFFTFADDTGAFSFRRLTAGTYNVIVEAGNEYEPVNEQVDVTDGGSARSSGVGRTYNLSIQLRLKKGNTGPAAVINAALAGVPQPAAALYLKALESERAGDNNKALEQLQQAVALYPDFALALNEIGVIYQKLGQLDRTLDALSAAVRIAPEVFELRLNYGIVLMMNKQFREAETELRRATELKDTSTLAHLYHGKVMIQLRDYPQAEKELQYVIKLGGGDVAMAYRFLGALYNERGENKLAVEALETYLSLAPKAKDADSVREIIKQLRTQAANKQ